jgi:hypothetical protein
MVLNQLSLDHTLKQIGLMIHQLLESRNLELHENNNVGENDAECNNEAVVGKCKGYKERIFFD